MRDPARSVSGEEEITVEGRAITGPERSLTYIFNKPAGVVSTAQDTHGRPTVTEFVPAELRLYPVGRLDIDTTGLLLLTNDGELANRLTHPRYEVPKTYRATVRPPVNRVALTRLREGIELDDGQTAPAEVTQIGPGTLELTLREGRKRQVRRMCEAVGCPVRELRRTHFGPLGLGRLKQGQVRRLSERELRALRQVAGL